MNLFCRALHLSRKSFTSRASLNIFPVVIEKNIIKQRFYAGLILLGAGILLLRTVLMIAGGAFDVLVWWVGALLLLEMVTDLGVIATAIPWFRSGDATKDSLPLKLGAVAAILHAFRVLIFAMGRIEPWLNFDVRPEHHALHGARWEWWHVYVACALSIAGVVGVIVIWRLRKRRR